jgi:acyl-CoA thioesterase-1
LHDELMQHDGIHPTAEAQPVILENVWEELGPMLQDERAPEAPG